MSFTSKCRVFFLWRPLYLYPLPDVLFTQNWGGLERTSQWCVFSVTHPWQPVEGWRVDRQWRWHLPQINVIAALIWWKLGHTQTQTHTQRERQRERERSSVAFRCLCLCLHHHHLSSPALSFHWLWWAACLLCIGLFKRNTPRGNSRGSQGPVLSGSDKAATPEPRGPNPSMGRLVLHSRPAAHFPRCGRALLFSG